MTKKQLNERLDKVRVNLKYAEIFRDLHERGVKEFDGYAKRFTKQRADLLVKLRKIDN